MDALQLLTRLFPNNNTSFGKNEFELKVKDLQKKNPTLPVLDKVLETIDRFDSNGDNIISLVEVKDFAKKAGDPQILDFDDFDRFDPTDEQIQEEIKRICRNERMTNNNRHTSLSTIPLDKYIELNIREIQDDMRNWFRHNEANLKNEKGEEELEGIKLIAGYTIQRSEEIHKLVKGKEAKDISTILNQAVQHESSKYQNINRQLAHIHRREPQYKILEFEAHKHNIAGHRLRKFCDNLNGWKTARNKSKRPTKHDKLLAQRAKYNLTKDPQALFGDLLPYGKAISKKNDFKKLTNYYNLTQLIRTKADFQYTNGTLRHNGLFHTIDAPYRQVDDSTHFMLAAKIVERLHNRPDLINYLLSDSKGKPRTLKINLVRSFKIQDYAGFHFINEATLIKNLAWDNTNEGDDGLTHEVVGHGLDYDENNKYDGLLPFLSDKQKTEFIKAREELFRKYNNGGYLNLRSYAFTGRDKNAEFLATSIECFFERADRLKEDSPQLYEFYKKYFKYDPETLTDLD